MHCQNTDNQISILNYVHRTTTGLVVYTRHKTHANGIPKQERVKIYLILYLGRTPLLSTTLGNIIGMIIA
jgi:hypothetical protein